MIRKAVENDSAAISEIYNFYVKNTVITFEEIEVSVDEMKQRIKTISEKFPFLVFEENKRISGYAYASTWKTRSAYRFTPEITVYVDVNLKQRGVGKRLYSELISILTDMEFKSLIAVIALPNEASVKLHESFGFFKAGHFASAGYKFENWIDVGYWQKFL